MLIDLGFDRYSSLRALRDFNNNIDAAIQHLEQLQQLIDLGFDSITMFRS